ncbi:MAG: UV DNA damage repair endonuclease UvsE [Candidatus Lokiarchaeota archaeon]|nr:UV DNA damage repair endonuclease UvsE [Candidatus Lokiarchaeota archaeon]MBD3342668.1 UV DNA damage repair endonuclease UvsE [Candidatus Lokiarchaeota archaeon]
MKIGYPCVNLSLKCRSSRTFRLRNYSEERIRETISGNLDCLQKILEFNVDHNLYFFRITSDLIPFASHPVMNFNWKDYFKTKFEGIGNYIKKNNMRITMHPGQYTVLNSKRKDVFERSLKELKYHIEVLDLLKLDQSAKVQVHVGGVYNEKKESINRFISRYKKFDNAIKNRLVIENDDKSYHVNDCLEIYNIINIPIIFDVFHHECYNHQTSMLKALNLVIDTWNAKDGLPILHYSSQKEGKSSGSHAYSIDIIHFKEFVEKTNDYDFDLMLEIKDKEKSALKALKILKNDNRLRENN